ncbi:hypothetical protein TNCV_3029911 [Trichonephila clavipes]|nr:hypothetical protein TNCV_3029911 [Trichonephila clavipes]
MKDKIFIENVVDKSVMFTITVQHKSYEILHTLLDHPLAVGEDSLPDSKLIFAENGRSALDFRSTLYKWSDDSYLRDEQQLLYLLDSGGLSVTTFKMLSSRFGLRTALRRSASRLVM